MNVKLQGKALICDTYTRKNTGEVVNQLKVWDGRDMVRVAYVPDLYRGIAFGEDVSFDVRILQTENGMFIVYDDVK